MKHQELPFGGEQESSLMEETRAERPRRAGRGRLVSVDSWAARASLLDPEFTRTSDEVLTKIALNSANSESNASIQRSIQQAADDLEHISSVVPKSSGGLLKRALEVGPGDSLRDTAKRIGAYPAQLSRAYEAGRRAGGWRVFRGSRRNTMPSVPAFVEYRPPVVPFERVMMTHQGPILSSIGPDLRTCAGSNRLSTANETNPTKPSSKGTDVQHAKANTQEPTVATGNEVAIPFPEINGCKHTLRQWLKAGFADLRLTCLNCRAEFTRMNPFVQNV
jgi:hypothetical protein